MSKATKTITAKLPKPDRLAYSRPDHKLIRLCVQFQAAMGAFHAAGNADPDGDHAHSEKVFERAYDDAWGHLKQIAKLSARTMSGLSSKARIAPSVIEDMRYHGMDETADAFLCSFAADARRLADVIVDEQWHTALDASRATKGGAA